MEEDMKTAPSVLGSAVPTLIERVARRLAAHSWELGGNEHALGPFVERRWPMYVGQAYAALMGARDFGNIPAEVASLAVETAKHDKTGEVLVWHVWTGMIDAALPQAKANA
jgi:hypothetical protein